MQCYWSNHGVGISLNKGRRKIICRAWAEYDMPWPWIGNGSDDQRQQDQIAQARGHFCSLIPFSPSLVFDTKRKVCKGTHHGGVVDSWQRNPYCTVLWNRRNEQEHEAWQKKMHAPTPLGRVEWLEPIGKRRRLLMQVDRKQLVLNIVRFGIWCW